MNILNKFFIFCIILLCSCTGLKSKKTELPPGFNVDFKADYNEVWNLLLNHISSDYIVEKIDFESGHIKAAFKSKVPAAILDCGKLHNHGFSVAGTPFSYIFDAVDTPLYTSVQYENKIFQNTRTLELEGILNIRLTKLDEGNIGLNLQLEYALHKYDRYKRVVDVKDLDEKEEINNIQHKVIYFIPGEVATFPSERFSPGNQLDVENYLSQINENEIDTNRFKEVDKANIFYSPPEILSETYPKESLSMYCVSNNVIENSIEKLIQDYLDGQY